MLNLTIAAALPALAAAVIYILEKHTVFGRIPYWIRQTIIGLVFGGLAVLATEWGIEVNGAVVNCRDASVMAAGLLFGGPAGILAGLIGGIERWFAVAWGVGSFTRVACTISTILAGFYAAALRKFMFEDKKPGWLLAFACGVVVEIFHLTMVFVTNMATPQEAMAVVAACTAPMVTSNGLSLLAATVALSMLSRENLRLFIRDQHISQTIQRWLLVSVVIAFFITSVFVLRLQNAVATSQADSLLSMAVSEVSADIRDFSDRNMLHLARDVARELNTMPLDELAQRHNLEEINVIGADGIISASTVPEYLGFDMRSGEQSAEFLCLLDNTQEFVQDYRPVAYDASISRKYAGIRLDSGFLQIGYDAKHFQRDIDNQVLNLSANRHVGNTGYVLIADQRRTIVSAPKDMNTILMSAELRAGGTPDPDQTFQTTLRGVDCFSRYTEVEGYFIVAAYPMDEAYRARDIVLYVNTFVEILVFAMLFIMIYVLVKRVVVNQIKHINASLAKITRGDLNETVQVRSNAEFASLSDDINTTVATLKRYIAEASARIDQELEMAKSIQSSALPNPLTAFPKRRDIDIFASMEPAKEVGGDFYDFYMTDGNTLNFLIADVSGKGIPAAMFMMRAKAELKTLTEGGASLGEVFTKGNDALCEGNDAGMFVTAWQGMLDLRSGLVRFANAGHNPPLIRRNGVFSYLKTRPGLVLAGMDGIEYQTMEAQLMPGDCLFLYTDGVTEATNNALELYGEQRLLELVNSHPFNSMKELCDMVRDALAEFVGTAPQFDDITMVALRYLGNNVPSIHFDAAQIADIAAATAFVEAELEKVDAPMKATMQLCIAVDEIFSNIVKYGYPDAPGPVTLQLLPEKDQITLTFLDEGVPYNPLTRDDPDVMLKAQENGIGGLGIYLTKKTMDEMKYRFEDGKNQLTIIKKL